MPDFFNIVFSSDFVGLLMLMAGYSIGLGAVTVIDIHGFLGRKSKYWTEATTRTHKVTKPMIWVGTGLVILGSFLFFKNDLTKIESITQLAIIPLTLILIFVVLILNGIFLSYSVSPYLLHKEREGRASELLPISWQRKIALSLIVSDLGWWGSLVLIVYEIVRRF